MKPELQRRVQQYGWDYSSPYYEKGWQRQLRPAQENLIEIANVKEGEHVLDISCGTGLVTFPLSQLVGRDGKLMGVDLSERMLEKAAREAKKLNVSNATFHHMDAEELDIPDSQFDVAINSLGLMYYPDPDKAIEEMYRVVKPGGRAVALVWGHRKACGWAGIFPIVDKRVKTDVCPLFFQPGTGNTLQNSFETTGFQRIEAARFDVPLHYYSEEEAVVGAFLGGAVALAYRKFDDKTREEANAEYLETIEPFRNGNGYDIPGEFVIVMGYK